MSAFTCDHGETYALFGSGGGQTLADEIGVELLGQIPLEPSVAAGGDSGDPVALKGEGPAADAFRADRAPHRRSHGAARADGRLQRPPARAGREGPRPQGTGTLTESLRLLCRETRATFWRVLHLRRLGCRGSGEGGAHQGEELGVGDLLRSLGDSWIVPLLFFSSGWRSTNPPSLPLPHP